MERRSIFAVPVVPDEIRDPAHEVHEVMARWLELTARNAVSEIPSPEQEAAWLITEPDKSELLHESL